MTMTNEPSSNLKITVIGVGGCGCNTISMLAESSFTQHVNLIAVNTDLAVLNHMSLKDKILIGENLTNGYGAGADPAVGFKAAQESEDLLKRTIQASNIVIITAGFGGGTGTGATPFIAQMAKELGIECIVVATLPFESEGQMRMDFALAGVEKAKKPANALVTLSNDLLLQNLGEKVGLFSAFNQSNEVLKNLLASLVKLLTETGFINVDLNDFGKVLSFEGEAVLGVGRANSEDESLAALNAALNNQLVNNASIESAQGVIVQICCKNEISLSTYESIISNVREKITNKSALVIAGVTPDETLGCELEILIIASGIKPELDEAESIDVVETSEAFELTQEKSYTDIRKFTGQADSAQPDHLSIPTFIRQQSNSSSALS